MRCTTHAIKRWAERILGYEDKKSTSYVYNNRDKIAKDIRENLKDSELVYFGEHKNNPVRNYYIKDNVMFVTNDNNDTVITVMDVDFEISDKVGLYWFFKDTRKKELYV